MERTRLMRKFFLVAFFLGGAVFFLSLGDVRAEEPAAAVDPVTTGGAVAVDEPVKAAEPITLTLPSGTVDLYPLVLVEEANLFQDGGTIGFVVKDSRGTKFSFCMDGRSQTGPSRPRHVFAAAVSPDAPGAVEVPIGGPEEKAVLKILEDWVAAKVPAELKERMAVASLSLNNDEFRVRLVLSVITTLRGR